MRDISPAHLNEAQLIEFLKEKLTIVIDKNYTNCYNHTTIVIRLMLDGQEICSDSFYLDE